MRNRSKYSSLSGTGNGHVARERDTAQLPPDTLARLTESLKVQWKRYRRQLRQCQRSFSEDAVHDLRVEARRLLSLLDLLSPFVQPACAKKACRVLKGHLDAFDDLRDAQVQLAALKKFRKKFSGAQKWQRYLKKRQPRLCRATRREARRLKEKPLGRLLKSWRKSIPEWLEQYGPRLGNPLLLRGVDAAFGRTQERRARINPEQPRSIHRTRIAFKKFRYMLEALAGHLPWAEDSLLERLRAYQGLMGDIQDGEVLLRNFEKFSRKQQIAASHVLEFTRELLRRRRKMIQRFLENSGRLSDFWPPVPAGPAPGRPNFAGQKIRAKPRQTAKTNQPKPL